MEFTNLKRQQDAIRPELDRRMADVLAHGRYILGPEVAELEGVLGAFCDAQCITVASGTEALLIALMALGIGPGDEVITTPFSFIATAEMIVLLGAKPVYADVEPQSGNIAVGEIAKCINSRTRAILPVSLFGQCAHMDEINQLAEKHGIAVIEDGAQSFGARYRGNPSCALSTIGTTSFFPSKPLGCYGDGGAVFTRDEKLARAIREIRVHGQSRRYHHTRIGVGGRMDTLQCAIVLAKWTRFETEIGTRAKIGATYTRLIHGQVPGAGEAGPHEARTASDGLKTLHIFTDRTSVYAQYGVLVPDRDRVAAALAAAGVPTAVHYPTPIHRQPAYAGLAAGPQMPVADWFCAHILCLPMGPDLTPDEQKVVVAALAQAL
ncbi:MAG: DegT/DnrJ/EryC1/StrS family aminotransferase [Alphaproteobacteria bacterium]|nr:DegT/DnrJ/EryC1/StrS family aminotransferase [Alphaproteobacteria bacterium]